MNALAGSMNVLVDPKRLSSSLKKTVASATKIVGLEETAAYLRTDLTDDIPGMELLIEQASDEAERITGRALCTATYRVTLSSFPRSSSNYASRVLELPRTPLIEVSSVQYYDTENAIQTLADTQYIVLTDNEPGAVYLLTDYSWPSTYDRPDAVQVTFTAGHGTDPLAIPAAMRQAAQLLCRFYFAGGSPNERSDGGSDYDKAYQLLTGAKVGGWTA